MSVASSTQSGCNLQLDLYSSFATLRLRDASGTETRQVLTLIVETEKQASPAYDCIQRVAAVERGHDAKYISCEVARLSS